MRSLKGNEMPNKEHKGLVITTIPKARSPRGKGDKHLQMSGLPPWPSRLPSRGDVCPVWAVAHGSRPGLADRGRQGRNRGARDR